MCEKHPEMRNENPHPGSAYETPEEAYEAGRQKGILDTGMGVKALLLKSKAHSVAAVANAQVLQIVEIIFSGMITGIDEFIATIEKGGE